MPKVLLYISQKTMLLFLFFGTDVYENRAHVHVGKNNKNDYYKKIIIMYKVEGYWNVEPKIKKIDFPVRGKIQIDFEDGRRLISPLSAFPSIKKVPVKQRRKWYLTAGGVTWDKCPEVIHVEQLLGNYSKYAHDE